MFRIRVPFWLWAMAVVMALAIHVYDAVKRP